MLDVQAGLSDDLAIAKKQQEVCFCAKNDIWGL